MRTSTFKYTILTWVSNLVILILLLVPFQGFLTVWASHFFGHYTAIRLWDEVVLALCIVGSLILVATDHKIRFNTLSRRLVWLILGYFLLTLVWGAIFYSKHYVNAKALGYGLVVNLRYLAFFLVTWAVALRISRLRVYWRRLVIWPAAVVVFLGLLEIFILPHNILKHFGYGPNTVPIQETINNNSHYLRFPSTLRGANPLGAYLIIPISVITVLIARFGLTWRRVLMLAGSFVVLFYTFSRSAWLGVIVSLFVALYFGKLSHKYLKPVLLSGAGLLVVAVVLFAALHNNTRFQNFVFHTQTNSSVASTSDGDHLSAFRLGLHNLLHHPLGRGPGTAGPASVYNKGGAVISEDYYIQIGQEVGWIGLFIYLMINLGVGYLLWLRRDDPLALSLLASLVGISLVNVLLYGWSDDTLAYIWWGLAGVAMVADRRLDNLQTHKGSQDVQDDKK